MKSDARHRRARLLADRIRNLLEGEAAGGPDLCRYVDTMYGVDSTPEISPAGEGGSDDCSLIELIFSPDTGLQIEIEGFLERSFFSEEDIAAVSDALCVSPPVSAVRFPSSRRNLIVPMPRWVIRSFVEKLHIGFQLPPELRQAIDDHVAAPKGNALKVMLRNFQPRLPGPKVLFISRFLAGADKNHEEFLACTTYLVSLLDEFSDDSDLLEDLKQKKQFYHRHLQDALRMRALLNTSNMETPLLSGVRMSTLHPEEAREKMRWIDRITLAAAGHVAWITDESMEIAYEPTDIPRF